MKIKLKNPQGIGGNELEILVLAEPINEGWCRIGQIKYFGIVEYGSAGTLGVLQPLSQYSLCCFMRRSGSASIAGVLEFALTDVNGNVLAMSADGGGALFSPAVTRIVIPMSASTVFPVSQFCYVVACSVFATTAPGIDGDNALGAGVAIGGAPAGTPVLAATIGAATQSTPPAISSNLGAIASVAGCNFYAAAA